MKRVAAVAVVLVLVLGVSMISQGRLRLAVAAAAAPTMGAPANGQVISSFGPTLSWTNPTGVTQIHLQLEPFNGDGPGADLLLDAVTSFRLPAPPEWYGLLPDMTYTWRVRASDAAVAVGTDDASWSTWVETTFRTPSVSSGTISAVSPANGAEVASTVPTLQWSNSNTNVWFYEVQVSKDAAFGSSAFLYQELRHGGVSNNSYKVPDGFPLERGAT